MAKSPRTVCATISIDTDDDQIDIDVTARVVPPEFDPPTGWTVEVIDAHTTDGLCIDNEMFRAVEMAVADDPAELIGAWIYANDRDADDAADMRREERRA